MTLSQPVHNEELSMQRLMHEIVRYLVDDEAAVRVDCLDGNDGVTTLNVHVGSFRHWKTHRQTRTYSTLTAHDPLGRQYEIAPPLCAQYRGRRLSRSSALDVRDDCNMHSIRDTGGWARWNHFAVY